ncbi:hypothetical protein ES703_121182 [subsurface metagenome]
MDVPTESIVQDREIRIEVKTKGDDMIYSYSVHDPRVIYEEEAPEFSRKVRRPTGEFSVTVPYDPKVERLVLIGQTPELKALKESFTIKALVEKAYIIFKEQ